MTKKELMGKTKKALVSILKGFTPTTEEDNDIITYTLDSLNADSRNVTKPELADILVDLFSNQPSPVENKTKKVGKKVIKTEEQAEQELMDILEEQEVVENKTKKVAKKVADKKKPQKEVKETKEEVKKETTEKIVKPRTIEIAVEFPKEFQSKIGLVKLRDDIKDVKQFKSEIDKGTSLIFGVFWNERILKQFDYDAYGILKGQEPDSFPNDLDLLDTYYATENVIYAISMYTECHYTFLPSTFNVDPKTGLRYSGGLEYEVYEIIEPNEE